jgi:hypothetical protein
MLPVLFATLLVASFGPMDSGAPAREPQLAVNGSFVALAFGAGNRIYFSASHDSGGIFSPPVKVAEAAVIPLSRHRGPRIAIAGNAVVISAVVGKSLAEGPHAHGLPSDGDLVAWRSIDGGKSWAAGVTVNDVPGAATEGLHALASDGQGVLFAAWLDKRSGHGTKLYGSLSRDGGVSWSKNILIYDSPEGTICECCHPSATIGSDGNILVMWRNWLEGSRDMYLARSSDGLKFSKPEKLGAGTWKLNACPMDGGGIAIAGSRIVTAWRRERDIFIVRPGAQETVIGTGVDVAIAGGPRGVYVIWSGPAGVETLIPGRSKATTVAPKGSFPAIAALPDGGALAAWEDDGKIEIEQLPERAGS